MAVSVALSMPAPFALAFALPVGWKTVVGFLTESLPFPKLMLILSVETLRLFLACLGRSVPEAGFVFREFEEELFEEG